MAAIFYLNGARQIFKRSNQTDASFSQEEQHFLSRA
jgi:hypothetical protein